MVEWTDEMVATLRKHVEVSGMSIGAAARLMGLNKNQAIGKASRMGIKSAFTASIPGGGALSKPAPERGARTWRTIPKPPPAVGRYGDTRSARVSIGSVGKRRYRASLGVRSTIPRCSTPCRVGVGRRPSFGFSVWGNEKGRGFPLPSYHPRSVLISGRTSTAPFFLRIGGGGRGVRTGSWPGMCNLPSNRATSGECSARISQECTHVG